MNNLLQGRGRCAILVAAAITTLASSQSVPAFAGPLDYDAGPGFNTIAPIADLDGDGRDDLVVKPLFQLFARYRLANPNGSLGPMHELALAADSGLSAEDGGDGTPELFVYDPQMCPLANIHGFMNDGRTCAPGSALALAPFTIPLPCSGPNLVRSVLFEGGSVTVVVSSGTGVGAPAIQRFAFQPPTTPGGQPGITPDGAPYTSGVLLTFSPSMFLRPCGDLDGDGTPDMIIRHVSPFAATTFELVRMTAGGLVLNAPTSFIVVQYYLPVDSLSCDLDGDGYAEVIAPRANGTGARLFRNHGPVPGGDGGVELVPELMDTGGLVLTGFADIDGDGDEDVLGRDPAGNVRFLLNQGPAGFSLASTVLAATGDASASGDFDGDGDADIVTVGAIARVWLNQLVPSTVSRPGTGDAVSLASDVHDPAAPPHPLTSAPLFDFKNASGGDAIEIGLASTGFAGSSAMLVAEVFATGCPPAFPLSHLYATGTSGTHILASFTVPPGGAHALTIGAPALPPGPHNLSGILQLIVFSPEALNGAYATTEAHEIQF